MEDIKVTIIDRELDKINLDISNIAIILKRLSLEISYKQGIINELKRTLDFKKQQYSLLTQNINKLKA
jgi:hypothetical protein